ncbi:MLP-like protein 43 [Tanacetum coccineum]
MALAGKLIGYVEISKTGDVFHDLFRHSPHKMVAMTRDKVHDCELHEGERGAVGSVITWHYTHAAATIGISCISGLVINNIYGRKSLCSLSSNTVAITTITLLWDDQRLVRRIMLVVCPTVRGEATRPRGTLAGEGEFGTSDAAWEALHQPWQIAQEASQHGAPNWGRRPANSSLEKLMRLNLSFSNGYPSVDTAVMCAKASMLIQSRHLRSARFTAYVSNVGGELVDELYKSFTIILHVEPKGEGQVATWTFEFEKPDTSVPYPTSMMDYLCDLVKDIDAHNNDTKKKETMIEEVGRRGCNGDFGGEAARLSGVGG